MLLVFYLLFDAIFNAFFLLFCCMCFSGSQSDIRWHQIHRSPQNLLFPAVGTEDTLPPLWFSVSFILLQEDVRTNGLPCLAGSFLYISLHLLWLSVPLLLVGSWFIAIVSGLGSKRARPPLSHSRPSLDIDPAHSSSKMSTLRL